MHSISNPCDESFITASKLIGDKWNLQIIHILSRGEAQRFSQLQDSVSGICPRTLSARLDQLEAYQVIQRRVFAEVPPRVEYCLTAKGTTLLPVIDALERWSTEQLAPATPPTPYS